MGCNEVLEHKREVLGTNRIASGRGVANVVENDAPNTRHPFLGMNQILGELDRDDLGYVLMLGNRGDLLFVEIAEIQAVSNGQHVDNAALAPPGQVMCQFSQSTSPPGMTQIIPRCSGH